MASLRQLFTNQNGFSNRNIALNLRNVGKRTTIFGLQLHEILIGFVLAILGAFAMGFLAIMLWFVVWAGLAYARARLKKGIIIRKIYFLKVPKKYTFLSEKFQALELKQVEPGKQ